MLPHALLLLACLAAPQDWFVDASAANCGAGNGMPGTPFCTITEAIGAASDGDTIHIAPGTYVENLTLDKDLELRGIAGDATTIVDGNKAGCVVVVTGSTSASIDGLTLRNGQDSSGGGISVHPTPEGLAPTVLTLTNSTVSDNTVDTNCRALGGGIRAGERSVVTLIRCTVRNNVAIDNGMCLGPISEAFGGGIFNEGNLSLIECVFDGNLASSPVVVSGQAVQSYYTGSLNASSCLFTNHDRNTDFTGGAVLGTASTILTILKNCTFAGNGHLGSVINLRGGPAMIDACVLWDNEYLGEAISAGSAGTVTHSLVQGGWAGAGANNIDLDPLFTDPTTGDYSLLASSPCIDAGGPGTSLSSKGLAGNPRRLDGDLDRTMVVDMGAYEFGNVHLAVSGNATPGGMLTVDLSGTAGMTLRLVVASTPGELVYSPAGTLFFDLGSPFSKFNAGTLPNSLNLQIPSTLPSGTLAVFQALAIGSPLPNGRLPLNFSNAVELLIE